MEVHRYAIDVPLDALLRDTHRATTGWDWGRGAYGHALSLPAYRELHPYARYTYENYPCAGLLDECPAFRDLFESLRCGLIPPASPRPRLRLRMARRRLEGPWCREVSGSACGWSGHTW